MLEVWELGKIEHAGDWIFQWFSLLVPSVDYMLWNSMSIIAFVFCQAQVQLLSPKYSLVPSKSQKSPIQSRNLLERALSWGPPLPNYNSNFTLDFKTQLITLAMIFNDLLWPSTIFHEFLTFIIFQDFPQPSIMSLEYHDCVISKYQALVFLSGPL